MTAQNTPLAWVSRDDTPQLLHKLSSWPPQGVGLPDSLRQVHVTLNLRGPVGRIWTCAESMCRLPKHQWEVQERSRPATLDLSFSHIPLAVVPAPSPHRGAHRVVLGWEASWSGKPLNTLGVEARPEGLVPRIALHIWVQTKSGWLDISDMRTVTDKETLALIGWMRSIVPKPSSEANDIHPAWTELQDWLQKNSLTIHSIRCASCATAHAAHELMGGNGTRRVGPYRHDMS